jgi:DNA-binding NtrC family response regulator
MKPTVNHLKTILLIDDDADDGLFLGHALTEMPGNITLSCKQNVDHLFETIDACRPFLILIDYHMPKRNGLDLLSQIKSHPDYKHIPVVIWSTSSLSKDVVAAYKEGAQAFVQKPCCYTDLVAELRGILKKCKTEFQ